MFEEPVFIQTIDLQFISSENFGDELEKLELDQKSVNIVVLEGREKPATITDEYIQTVLATINRFSRSQRIPSLFVVPTVEDQVARSWCDHGVKIGDLIPETKLYEGSRWYNFPGVSKDAYVEVAAETVRALNPHTPFLILA